MQITITYAVGSWDTPDSRPNVSSNLDMGKGILGVLLHPAARSVCMVVTASNTEQLASTGIVDDIQEYKVYSLQ